MNFFVIDKTLLNLATILISGAGVFAILFKYDVPQLNASFWGSNPFAVKRSIIENYLTVVFIVIALVGLLVQVVSNAWGDKFEDRLHTTDYYLVFFLVGILVMMLITYAAGSFGKALAREKWETEIIGILTTSFEESKEIVKNNGFKDEQLSKLDSYAEPQKTNTVKHNFRTTDETIKNLENLFELKNDNLSREERISKLSKYFDKYNNSAAR